MWWSRGQSGGCLAWRVIGLMPTQAPFFWKIHVGLWEKSCSFVGKIMSVCGIIPVSLWEKFGELSIVLDNSHQFVGKNQWTKVQCLIIPVSLWEKITGLLYLRLFAEVRRLTTSIWRKIRRNLKHWRWPERTTLY